MFRILPSLTGILLALPLSALAGDLAPAQTAAEECADAGGYLHCVEARDGALDCTCITVLEGKASDAYFVRVDRETTTAYFDGKFLTARDLRTDQGPAPATMWIDETESSCEIDRLTAELEDTANAAGGVLVHEVGHWLGAVRPEKGEVLGSDF